MHILGGVNGRAWIAIDIVIRSLTVDIEDSLRITSIDFDLNVRDAIDSL